MTQELSSSQKKKVLGYLGLSRVARCALSGETAVLNAIRTGSAFLVLIAGDASEGTRKKFTDKCTFYEVPCEEVALTREELGHSMGQTMRSVVAIVSEGLARQIIQTVSNTTGEEISGSN